MMKTRPPKWADNLLDWYCMSEYAGEIRGDLLELFDRWVSEKGVTRARWLYAINTILFLRAYNSRIRTTQIKTNQMTMVSHYLKIAVRNMARQKTYTTANIIGLSIGIAVSLIIFLHVDRELSFDKAYPKHETIYRLAAGTWAKSSPTQGEAFKDYMPEVKDFCRFAGYGGELTVLSAKERFFGLDNILLADQSAIGMFDYQFVAGSPEGALTRPSTVVLTESLAKKVFGEENPVGQTIELNESDKFEVTGVIKDLPANSHIKAELLVSMPTFMNWVDADWYSNKGWMVMYTYVLFDNKQQAVSTMEKMLDFQMDYREVSGEEDVKDMMAEGFFYELMPLTDIHLYSDKIQEMGPNSSVVYVYIFVTLAIFILVIACVNFINIFVTLSIKRMKEIGMRKVMGAQRMHLVQQFLGEALLTATFSAALALLFCVLALPFYNSIAGLSVQPAELITSRYLLVLMGIVLFIGVVAGAYPAFMVSGFTASRALSAKKEGRSNVSGFRKGLVVFQFVLSLFIIICTVAVTDQMNFVREKDLGFSSSQVVAIKTYGNLRNQLVDNREGLYARLKENPAIEEISLSSNLMGDQLSVESFRLASSDPNGDYPQVNVITVDENFLETLDIELVSGRTFEPKTDTGGVYIINETLARQWGVANPVGEMALLETRDESGPIVGMIKDIHYYSLHRTVEPMLISFKPWWTNYMLVEINGQNVPETMAYLEGFVKEIAPSSIFHYRFLDDRMDALYKDEYSMFKIFRVFSALAIMISCIGLLGLAAIEVQRRTKEIGIRKVLGASSKGILTLLSRQFVVMIGLAIFVTVPLSYVAINRWLTSFEYHIEPGVLIYLIPSILFILLAFGIVCLQALKTATANPSESLRYE